MRYMSPIRCHGHIVIFLFIIGSAFISRTGIALADSPSQTTIDKHQPGINAGTSFGRIPVTTLDLTLTGVVKGWGKNIAVISVHGDRDKLFRIGETISTNVKLLAVDSTGAVISNGGVAEWLDFSRKDNMKADKPNTTIPDTRVTVPMSVQPRLFESGLVVAFIPGDAIQNMGNNKFRVKRSLIEEQLHSGDLLATAKFEPETGGGLRITDIVPGGLYDTLGLKDGDTLSSINGKPFKSVAELVSILAEKRDNNATTQVKIMRGGTVNNLQLDFH